MVREEYCVLNRRGDPGQGPPVRIPDLFIVGAPRCGTTSLYTYLKQHPEIYLSVLKEPHFFSTDLTSPPQAIVDQEEYLNLFAGARQEKRAGEGSVWYLFSTDAPARIHDLSPMAKIIVMLRNPIDMIYSLHALYIRTGNEDLEDFEAALAAEPDRKRGQRFPARAYFPEGLRYTEVAKYAVGVQRYLRTFGRDQVHTILFEDFLQDTARVYKETLEFLNVDPGFEPEYDLEKAAAKLRFVAIRQMRTVPPEIRQRMRFAAQTHRGSYRKPLKASLRPRLQEHFAADIDQLSELLARDLSHWR